MKTRIPTIVSFALIITLLAASLPNGLSIAKGKEDQINCPPFAQNQLSNPAFKKSIPRECLIRDTVKAQPLLQSSQLMLFASTGGPDDFGYTFDDTVPFNWVNVPTGNGITGADDYALGPIDFGWFFTFPFYGSTYSNLYISSNGLITFGEGSCCNYGGSNIPSTGMPNNFIAPFWEDLVVGSPYNSGAVWYTTGGIAPDRYFVAEWRDVTTYAGSDPFSFQVILYENGDILVQHQSLPGDYYSTVGIENSLGNDGLEYQSGCCDLAAPKAIKFFYPTGPIARVQVSPLSAGKFASTSSNTYFPVTITNNGSAGTDTYNLSSVSSWTSSLYQDGCVTPLTDTNADTIVDTGPILEGGAATICVGISPPAGAVIGDMNTANITVTSSLDPAKTKNTEMNMVIPSSFAQVLEDYEDAAMAFRINQPAGILTNYVTNDFYYGSGPATAGLPDGMYIYVWNKTDDPNAFTYSDIEFAFVSGDGTTSTPVEKLTSNANNRLTMDFAPSVAVTPDGTIGVIWYRFIADDPNGSFVYNFNIYFATLSNTGELLSGPVNVTNNILWDDYDDINVPHYSNPSIAGTDDNRFVLSWSDYRTDGMGNYSNNIWYGIFESTGAVHVSPAAFTNDNNSNNMTLNPLSGGNVIMTWNTLTFLNPGYSIDPYYSIMNSDGTILKNPSPLETDSYYSPDTDAALLPNGSTAIMLGNSFSVSLFILDENYDISSGPHYAGTPNTFNGSLSVTYDASNRIIMTWEDQDSYPSTNLMYALADDTGTFITNPIPMRSSTSGLLTSFNGQGNAPYPLEILQEPLQVGIDIKPDNTGNPINTKSKGKIPVAILSTTDFDALVMVDTSSLTFGSIGNEASLSFCNPNGEDVNGDGLPDLVCHFKTQMTGFQFGDTEGILMGSTVDGTPLEGKDVVKILN